MKKQNLITPILVAVIGIGWPYFSRVSATEKTTEQPVEQKETTVNTSQKFPSEDTEPQKKKTKEKPPSKVEALLKSTDGKQGHYKKF